MQNKLHQTVQHLTNQNEKNLKQIIELIEKNKTLEAQLQEITEIYNDLYADYRSIMNIIDKHFNKDEKKDDEENQKTSSI